MRYVIAPILRDPQEREECLSEVTMRVWEKIAPFQEERGSWNGWLTSLTRHAAPNHARRISRHGGAEALSEDPPSPNLTPEEVLLRQERQTALQAALGAAIRRRAASVLPKILLSALHRPDLLGAGAYGAGGGGTAIPAETAAAEIAGR